MLKGRYFSAKIEILSFVNEWHNLVCQVCVIQRYQNNLKYLKLSKLILIKYILSKYIGLGHATVGNAVSLQVSIARQVALVWYHILIRHSRPVQ